MSRTTTSVAAVDNFGMGSTLRSVDLNLLTVFDAVMQEQNITRAAQNLGMSQPAVSNAVARLKVMFNDELFIRHGRGIQPTQRAKQLFGPLRQALQLVKNELPCSIFAPLTSSRTFKLAICSPLDMRFAPTVLSTMREQAPHIQLQLEDFLTEYSPINFNYWKLYREEKISKEKLRYCYSNTKYCKQRKSTVKNCAFSLFAIIYSLL